MSAMTLLAQADAALAGTSELPKGTRARIAAWYTRGALENVTTELLIGRMTSDPAELTMASRLACLRVLRPELSDDASHAWWALSRVCHQHAYELTPTATEVTHLIDQVASLAEATAISQISIQ